MLFSQVPEGRTHSGQKTGQPAFPVQDYSELANPAPTPLNQWENVSRHLIGWGNTDIRYKKEEPVNSSKISDKIQLSAWKGERVSAQFAVSAVKDSLRLSFDVSDLVHKSEGKRKISKESISTAFVRYVISLFN